MLCLLFLNCLFSIPASQSCQWITAYNRYSVHSKVPQSFWTRAIDTLEWVCCDNQGTNYHWSSVHRSDCFPSLVRNWPDWSHLLWKHQRYYLVHRELRILLPSIANTIFLSWTSCNDAVELVLPPLSSPTLVYLAIQVISTSQWAAMPD